MHTLSPMISKQRNLKHTVRLLEAVRRAHRFLLTITTISIAQYPILSIYQQSHITLTLFLIQQFKYRMSHSLPTSVRFSVESTAEIREESHLSTWDATWMTPVQQAPLLSEYSTTLCFLLFQ